MLHLQDERILRLKGQCRALDGFPPAALTGVPPVEAMELLLDKLKKTGNNIEFLLSLDF